MDKQLQRKVCYLTLVLSCACGDGLATRHVGIVDDVALRDSLACQHRERRGLPVPDDGLPLLLIHGMAGFRPIASLLDYFYRVRLSMLARGFRVYALQTDAFQSVAYRARQLALQIDEVLALTGAPRVHVIAHSQGGLDMRYLIASMGYGDRIATLVTVGTPHHGVRLVDMALEIIPPWAEPAIDIANKVANVLLGGNNDILAQLHDLTHAYVDGPFNRHNTDDARVAYYSYAGITQPNPFVDTALVDVVNPFLAGTHKLMRSIEGDNDGLVAVDSARWGTYMGSLAADHWDQIGQPPNMPHLSFNHLDFYHALGKFLGMGGDPPLFE